MPLTALQQSASDPPQPPGPSVKIRVVTICNNCTTINVPFSNSQIKVSNPPRGYQRTDFSFEVEQGGTLTLEAPFAATANGLSLEFLHWFSVTDQRVITTSQTFSGQANKSEEIAAVYDTRRTNKFVRVQAIRVADTADGFRRAPITPNEVKLWVDKANEVFAPSRVQFLFTPDVNGPDWLDLVDPIINKMDGGGDPDWPMERDRANLVASNYPDKMVVFFRWGCCASPTGGGFSGTDINFIAMPRLDPTAICGRPNIGLFAHEVGHYLGLPHTFIREFQTVPQAEAYLREQSSKYLPMAGDFNRDGKDDSIAFTRGDTGDVYVSPSDGKRFLGARVAWNNSFSFGDEIPAVGDFNGDGKDDVATFTRGGAGDVFVALSDGTKFEPAALWHNTFCFGNEIPAVGDFNGDGKDDVATFTRGGAGDVFVALSDGRSFVGNAILWHNTFCFGEEIPAAGDFNGDGKDDIATFTRGGAGDVFVALSNGQEFIGNAILWHNSFCFGNETPAVGDFNGDGKDDVATFTRGGAGDVFVALSDGQSFVGNAILWHDSFCFGDEFPVVGDFNGDGADDIATFTRGNSGDAFVALSNRASFAGNAVRWQHEFNFYPLVFDGDEFSDTEPDPMIRNVTDVCPAAMSVTLDGTEFRLPRTNVMSYYHPNASQSTEVRTLSQQQIDKVRGLFRTRFPRP